VLGIIAIVGLGWLFCLISTLALCRAAGRADRIERQLFLVRTP
jgi:hypothetical protein